MYIATISFPSKLPVRKAALMDLADAYLTSLADAGQIGATTTLAWTGGVLTAYVEASHPDALLERNHTEWGLKSLRAIRQKTGSEPVFTILDDEVPKRFPVWNRAPFLVLYANYWDDDHPIRRGTDGFPFPSYQLPIDQPLMHNLLCWRDEYQCLMGVWFRSGPLETRAYRQLADPSTALGKDARRHCREIEESTGIPTFYFLFRYWKRRESESSRVCPLCGRPWLLERPHASRKRGWRIQFKCDECRIVSDLGDVYDGERHARIGEYPEKAIQGTEAAPRRARRGVARKPRRPMIS